MHRIGLHLSALVAMLVLAVGIMLVSCVSSPEVKLASTQMTAALDELHGSVTMFRNLYVAEIEKTRADISNAVVARTVTNKINELSASLEDKEWQQKFKEHGLIALSKEIEDAQASARALVNMVSKITLKQNEDAAAKLDELLSKQAEAMRKSAKQLRDNKLEFEAQKLEEKAKDYVAYKQDPMIVAYLKAILELGAIKAEVPKNLKNLEILVKILQKTHAVVDEWIMTDVTVSGAQVGQLLVKHAKELGLETPAEKGGAE